MAHHRMRPLLAAAAIAVLTLSACSTGPSGEGESEPSGPAADSRQFPVTIEHAFGETVIEKAPERVATISWVNDDVALALGVVPVGMPVNEYGGNEKGSTPWKDAKLEELDAAIGSENAPAQYSEADGIAFEDIAKSTPDVILAAYSGLSQEDYDRLTKIAPVVAYPETAYGTGWQKSTEMIGKALGFPDKAAQLVEDTEKLIEDKAAEYPEIQGKTFIYGNLEPASGAGANVYTPNDNRPKFLASLGMELAPVVAEKAKDEEGFFIEWSAERADELKSDIFVTWVPDASTEEAIIKDPLLGQIPAVKAGGLVAHSDNTLVLSVSAASPLSLPWALDKYLPDLSEAVKASTSK